MLLNSVSFSLMQPNEDCYRREAWYGITKVVLDLHAEMQSGGSGGGLCRIATRDISAGANQGHLALSFMPRSKGLWPILLFKGVNINPLISAS